ncbi:WWE domain [Trinorchestia longiramus]|nr:WWE domain [Trinorchestia longiramus]
MASGTDDRSKDEISIAESKQTPQVNVGMITRSKSNSSEKQNSHEDEDDLCSVCLEYMIHPVKLPCSHIFCFLCIKGVALTNGHICPLCRGVINSDFFIQPVLATPPQPRSKKRTETKKSSSQKQLRSNFLEGSEEQEDDVGTGTASHPNSESYQWFYEGKNGWWRYDARTNGELEAAHVAGLTSVTVMLAGYNFVIDFNAMNQRRVDGGGMTRQIKRDSAQCRAKGTAGLHTRVLAQATKNKRKRNN